MNNTNQEPSPLTFDQSSDSNVLVNQSQTIQSTPEFNNAIKYANTEEVKPLINNEPITINPPTPSVYPNSQSGILQLTPADYIRNTPQQGHKRGRGRNRDHKRTCRGRNKTMRFGQKGEQGMYMRPGYNNLRNKEHFMPQRHHNCVGRTMYQIVNHYPEVFGAITLNMNQTCSYNSTASNNINVNHTGCCLGQFYVDKSDCQQLFFYAFIAVIIKAIFWCVVGCCVLCFVCKLVKCCIRCHRRRKHHHGGHGHHGHHGHHGGHHGHNHHHHNGPHPQPQSEGQQPTGFYHQANQVGPNTYVGESVEMNTIQQGLLRNNNELNTNRVYLN